MVAPRYSIGHKCDTPEYEQELTVYHGVGMGKGLACEGWPDEAVRFWTSQQS